VNMCVCVDDGPPPCPPPCFAALACTHITDTSQREATSHQHPPTIFKTEMIGKQPAPDGAELSALALGGKRPFKFILMGTPEVC
jgi:hypothetical protein